MPREKPFYLVVFKDRRAAACPIIQGDIRAVLNADNLEEVEFFQRLPGSPKDYLCPPHEPS